MEEIHTNLLEPQNQPKRKIWKYIFLFLTLVILFYIGGKAYQVYSEKKTNPSQNITTKTRRPSFFTQLKNLILSKDRELEGENEDRINILLLGIGGEGHDGPYLADTIIILSLKPKEKQVAMLSIPRDLLVNIPNYNFAKINLVNAIGETRANGSGPAFTAEIISQMLNLPIHYYVRVDFSAFKELIDEVDDIDVSVDKNFTDYNYPTVDHKLQTISFEKGWQKMDGDAALKFARSRHGGNGEGSDFARSRRQQKILTALKNKIFSSSTLLYPWRIKNMMQNLNTNVVTNLEFWEITRFYKLAKELDYENMINRVLSNGPNQPLIDAQYNGSYVLETRTGDFTELGRIAQNIFMEKPSNLTEPALAVAQLFPKNWPRVEIQNGTWIFGLSAKTKLLLEEKKMPIFNITNAAKRDYEKTAIYDLSGGKFAKIITQLKNELSAEILNEPNAGLSASSTDIVIIVGTDREKK